MPRPGFLSQDTLENYVYTTERWFMLIQYSCVERLMNFAVDQKIVITILTLWIENIPPTHNTLESKKV